MNKTILMGRLTADPELKMTPNSVNTTRFNIAVQRNYKNKEDGYDADFISCVAWRERAEFICKYFKKGDMICICGRIETRSWESDGVKKFATDVIVEEAGFCGSKNQSTVATSVPAAPSTPQFPNAPVEADGDLPF